MIVEPLLLVAAAAAALEAKELKISSPPVPPELKLPVPPPVVFDIEVEEKEICKKQQSFY